MACVKSVNRSASVALAPDGPYMAAGTMAGAVDMSFSSNANLEIFELDFRSDNRDLPLVGSCQSSERFNRLAWSGRGAGLDSYPLGLVAGGLVDGSIDIWNPSALIRRKEDENALVAHISYHKGPVRGLEFNSFTSNLLASGGDDGEVCIWDLAAPTEPSHFPPLKGSGSASQSEISYVSWNSKVQHILASTSNNGITVVWDLKKQKPVISVEDSFRRRCSALQWHPDVATQLVVASDDDGSPALRLWDMRNTMTPVKEFVGHTKGVIAMSWCPSDSSYLLTCAKDNRTICWNTSTGEIVRELPSGTNWNFDVHWYPKVPGVITASSFDGKIGVYNIEACSSVGDFDAGGTVRAPKWYKRPAGVSFAFGGKLLAFHPKSPGCSEVYVHTVVTEPSLASRSSEFEMAVQHGERSSLKALCEKKSNDCESADERETWGFLKVMFEEDGTARTRMLNHLGFSLPEDEKNMVADDISQDVNAVRLDDSILDNAEVLKKSPYGMFSADDGEDFFDNLSSPKADTPVQNSVGDVTHPNVINGTEETKENAYCEESDDLLLDDSIQRALVVGDYKGAVTKCISANKIADALVIAHVGGSSLWEKTRDQYLKNSYSPYLKVVAAMVNNDLISLVKSRPIKYWKETLAMLCTFAQSDEWSMLCNELASKLMSAGNTLPATLCYICAGNIDNTVEIWSRNITEEHGGKSYVECLQDLMEKTIVLALACGQKQFSSSLCKLVEKYAEILASQGLQTTAMEYLKLLGSDELPPELALLKERIAVSIEPEVKAATYENTHQPSEAMYTTQTSISQESTAHIRHENPYRDSYQPTQHVFQPSASPKFFVPSPSPQHLPANYGPPQPGHQPAMRTFVPATGPVIKNPEQFQQAPTLGCQLYPEAVQGYNPVLPTAGPQVSGPRMPQVMAPSPSPVGFRPVANTGMVQRPGPGGMQPSSPRHSTSASPSITPAPPAPTVQTVDTSNAPAKHKPVIGTLTRLFNETSEAMGGARANPARRREIDDNSKKIGALFAKLNTDDISKNASEKLTQLCQALDKNDYATALHIQVELTTSEWDECNFWLATLKRMIKTRQTAGSRLN